MLSSDQAGEADPCILRTASSEGSLYKTDKRLSDLHQAASANALSENHQTKKKGVHLAEPSSTGSLVSIGSTEGSTMSETRVSSGASNNSVLSSGTFDPRVMRKEHLQSLSRIRTKASMSLIAGSKAKQLNQGCILEEEELQPGVSPYSKLSKPSAVLQRKEKIEEQLQRIAQEGRKAGLTGFEVETTIHVDSLSSKLSPPEQPDSLRSSGSVVARVAAVASLQSVARSDSRKLQAVKPSNPLGRCRRAYAGLIHSHIMRALLWDSISSDDNYHAVSAFANRIHFKFSCLKRPTRA
jgi:hypothetical protein